MIHRERTCRLCGEKEEYDYQDGHAHDPGVVPGRDATCTQTGIRMHFQCIDCGRLFEDFDCTVEITEESTVIPALGHDWGEPTYTWSEDNSTCTAERVCRIDDSHKETETATAASEVTREPTAAEEGERTYTAAFENPDFETQTRVEAIPALGTATLTFDLGGGTLDGKTGQITVEAAVGDVIRLPGAPTRDGYTFQYWKGSEYEAGAEYTVEGDHTFTAVWEKDGESEDPGDSDKNDKPENTDKPKDSDNRRAAVNTGDDTQLLGWILMFAGALVSTIIVVLIRRRRRA